jgi:glycosyltransferase involved in cell wall biosynthesis
MSSSHSASPRPFISIIVPCYNEQSTIRLLLEAIHAQDYPSQSMEVVIADGMSNDGTRDEIALFQKSCQDLIVKIVDNPERAIPAALNHAIAAARGEYILRLDAHSLPGSSYVARCVRALQAGLGDNVGGIWNIQPRGESWQARAIATAAAHPLGVGDARYRVGGSAEAVDTVPFGAFHRSLFDRVGYFDETLLTNEDYEFNARIRRSGGTVWLDPSIQSTYFARGSFSELARQYWRYGFWKARMLRRYPGSFRWRQLAGLFVFSFLFLGILGFWLPWAWGLLIFEASVYTLTLILAGALAAYRSRDFALFIGTPLAIAVMHFAWGAAFLWSIFTSMFNR